ncbi:MAG: hypothetical protein JSS81_09920 [Acidobacteria bacterium]|nr:hypothetical protein [Acidobacteriota bacterium]
MTTSESKTKADILLFSAVAIAVIHIFRPVFLSPTGADDRTVFAATVMLFAVLAKMGYAFGRVGIGGVFLVCSVIDLMIAVAYRPAGFLELVFWGLILGLIGAALLFRKDIRVFETKRVSQQTQNI